MLSKTEDAWYASYVCHLQLTNTSDSRKNKLSCGGHVQFLPLAPFSNYYYFCDIGWSGCIMLVCSMLRVDPRYCACVHALSIHCTIMYPIPKHARMAQSRVQHSRMLLNCTSSAVQDVGTRNHTVMYILRRTLRSSN